jgi:hypothetical protein
MMKKLICFLLVSVMLFGCDAAEVEEVPEVVEETPEIQEEPEAEEIPEELPEIHEEPEEEPEPEPREVLCTELLLIQNVPEIIQAIKDGQKYEYLTLDPDNSRIIRYAMGDLNGDGIDDIAVVVEYATEILFHQTGIEYSFNKISPRHIYVLLGDENGNYTVAHKHESLVKTQSEGGRFGDAFDDMDIVDGLLHVTHLHGSAWSAFVEKRFGYNDGQFVLAYARHSHYVSTAFNNQETTYDLLNDTIQRTTRYHDDYENYDYENYETLLLYSREIGDEIYLFEEYNYYDFYDTLCFLPSYSDFIYSDWQPVFEITPSQKLDKIAEEYYPELEKVTISLTQENIDNYIKLLRCEFPLFYYEGEAGKLYLPNLAYSVLFVPSDGSDWIWHRIEN